MVDLILGIFPEYANAWVCQDTKTHVQIRHPKTRSETGVFLKFFKIGDA